jgi:hypothetical protein
VYTLNTFAETNVELDLASGELENTWIMWMRVNNGFEGC